MNIRLYIRAMVTILVPLLVSCRQDLCYDHFPTLEVKFNWEQEWERDYGVYHLNAWDVDSFGLSYDDLRPPMPEWVNMIQYYEGEPRVEHYVTPEGQSYIVEAGKECSMLFYNGDTEYIVIEDITSVNDARAFSTTRSRSSASMQKLYDVHSGARTTNPPDVIYSAFVSHVPSINNHEVKQYDIKMQPLVYTYYIMYDFDYGINNVALARGAIGGMAEAVYLRTGVTSEESTIVLFDCDVNAKGCIAKVHSFGAPGFPDIYYGRKSSDIPDRTYTLTLELRLRSGKTVDFSYDVSDQLKNQPRGGVIKITGLRIEDEPVDPNSGFQVEVTGWDDNSEIVDIPIGGQTKEE